MWIWEQTAIISLYSINWLVFITETECVYCAVWTASLNAVQVNSHVQSAKTPHSTPWPTAVVISISYHPIKNLICPAAFSLLICSTLCPHWRSSKRGDRSRQPGDFWSLFVLNLWLRDADTDQRRVKVVYFLFRLYSFPFNFRCNLFSGCDASCCLDGSHYNLSNNLVATISDDQVLSCVTKTLYHVQLVLVCVSLYHLVSYSCTGVCIIVPWVTCNSTGVRDIVVTLCVFTLYSLVSECQHFRSTYSCPAFTLCSLNLG